MSSDAMAKSLSSGQQEAGPTLCPAMKCMPQQRACHLDRKDPEYKRVAGPGCQGMPYPISAEFFSSMAWAIYIRCTRPSGQNSLSLAHISGRKPFRKMAAWASVGISGTAGMLNLNS